MMLRRTSSRCAAVLAVLALGCTSGFAQSFPSKPVEIVVHTGSAAERT